MIYYNMLLDLNKNYQVLRLEFVIYLKLFLEILK